MKKTGGQYGALLGDLSTLYQIASTSADIRIWSALPKEFQVAKVAAPTDGHLTVTAPNGFAFDVPVPKDKNSLVYVKIPTNNVPPVFDVLEM